MRKERSGIMFLGSGASIGPIPYFSIYCGTKIFVNYLAKVLSLEF